MKLHLDVKCAACGEKLPAEIKLETGKALACLKCKNVVVQSLDVPTRVRFATTRKGL